MTPDPVEWPTWACASPRIGSRHSRQIPLGIKEQNAMPFFPSDAHLKSCSSATAVAVQYKRLGGLVVRGRCAAPTRGLDRSRYGIAFICRTSDDNLVTSQNVPLSVSRHRRCFCA